jgi:hypothetical protein
MAVHGSGADAGKLGDGVQRDLGAVASERVAGRSQDLRAVA